MLASYIFTGLLATLTIASPIANEKRAASDILAAISNVQTNIATLNNTVVGFKKGALDSLLTVLKVQQQTDAVGKSLTSATQVVNNSMPLNFADSITVGLAVLNGLKPDTLNLLTNLQNKKPAFDAAVLGIGSVSPQVEQSLKTQKQQSATFGTVLTSKLDPGLAGIAADQNAQIAAAFDQAIATFAQPGGLFQVPAFPSTTAFQAALKKYGLKV